MKNIFLFITFLASIFTLSAQDSTNKGNTTWGGFAETYYQYDFNNPAGGNIPLAYNHHRHNEFAVNLVLITINYSSNKVRGNLGLQTGTYPEANYAAELQIFRHLYDANIGYKLAKKLWLDAGIFGSSHIGFEYAVSKNNWTLTRSLSAENTPYYEAGAKLTYEIDSHFTVSALVLNGWQNIRETNSNKALGSQIVWKPNDKITVNYSTFYGNEKPDSLKQMRFLNDVYTQVQLTKKLGIIAGIDIGTEQALDSSGTKLSGNYNIWYNPTLILRYAFTKKFAMAARCEMYKDEHGVILTGKNVMGYSVNMDYMPHTNIALRLEGRSLMAEDKIFTDADGNATGLRTSVTASMAISF
ncbi:MAG: porin [Sphingobacteriales bacterium]|nr:MAG: porin [Sphingobacteriales bacterium]